MDYIGSKEKLNDWIFSIILKDKTNCSDLTFLDACSGSGSTTKYAATLGFNKIISNDIMEFSSHIVRGKVAFPKTKLEKAYSLIDEMNNLEGKKEFFYQNYSENSGRPYFSNQNAKKIDSCRKFIEDNCKNDIYLKSYLLYCLIEALSSVSNTTGVQAAFLKKLKERAKNPLIINPQESLFKYQLVKIFNSDILTLLNNKTYRENYRENILYIDPPYNHRQYGPNYHLYETLVKYDNPIIHGKTGLRNWANESKSDFCSKKECLNLIRNIYQATTANNIYISYNSDGLLSIDDFCNEFSKNIENIYSKEYKRYKSDSSKNRTYNDSLLTEYLIHIAK